jgi:hypothetical protein
MRWSLVVPMTVPMMPAGGGADGLGGSQRLGIRRVGPAGRRRTGRWLAARPARASLAGPEHDLQQRRALAVGELASAPQP